VRLKVSIFSSETHTRTKKAAIIAKTTKI